MIGKLRWIVGRLRVMSFGEILRRLADAISLVKLYFEYRLYSVEKAIDQYQPEDYTFTRKNQHFFDGNQLFARAEIGEESFLGCHWRWRSDDKDIWNLAPDTGKFWPNSFFGLIQYRPGNEYGDIRIAWEPSRLQYLLGRAIAESFHSGPEFEAGNAKSESAICFEQEFTSWVTSNPYLKGIHYVSAMECALRLIAVMHTLDIYRNHISDSTWKCFLAMAESHGRIIASRLSLHSSAGNHTIAEAVGLLYAGILLPELEGAQSWLDTAVKIINEEVPRQIQEDGSGYEATSWYLLFVTDLVGLSVVLAEKNGFAFSPMVMQRLCLAKIFLQTLGEGPESLLRIGDSDDGFALSPLLGLTWEKEKLETARSYSIFKEAGVTVARMQDDAGDNAEVYFIHTPAGMPPLYGHSHADCLSLALKVKGQFLLGDPGTYTYNGDAAWRRYFRSSTPHNTLTIDGYDQFSQVSAFQWKDPYECSAIEPFQHENYYVFSASHNGYKKIGCGHRRAVIVSQNHCIILDKVSNLGDRPAHINWHPLSGGTFENNIYSSEISGTKVYFEWPDQVVEFINPEKGGGRAAWHSKSYGRKCAVTTIQAEISGVGFAEILTFIGLGARGTELYSSKAMAQIIKKLRVLYAEEES